MIPELRENFEKERHVDLRITQVEITSRMKNIYRT